jgi:hypothetical protein
MPRIQLSKDTAIRTFPKMPDRLDPLAADADTLRRYGIPQRPQSPYLQEIWTSALRSRPQFVQPSFRQVREPAEAAPDFIPSFLPPEADSVLAGAYADSPNLDERVVWINSELTVPSLSFPANYREEHEDNYKLEAWIGIHRESEVSVWCGYVGTVTWQQNKAVSEFVPTWQWAPDERVEIENFPLSAGDKIACLICVDPVFSSKADVYYYNRTEGRITHFRIDDYRNLRGTRAGWYVRPSLITSEGPVLAYFASIYFDACFAGTEDANILYPTTPVYLQDINTSKNIVYASILSDVRTRVDHAL